MRTYVLSVLLLGLCALPGCGKVTVEGPGDLPRGAVGTVTVTVVNDNKPTEERTLTLTATLYYKEAGVSKTASGSSAFKLLAGPGLSWTGLTYRLPDLPGLSYDWATVSTKGGVNARVDSAHVAAVDELKPGETWTTTVTVRAEK